MLNEHTHFHEEPLDEEERQLRRELEAGEWVPNPTPIITDEFEETVSALEATAHEFDRVQADPYRWKWVILTLHSALQGMMVLALQGSNGLRVLKPESTKRRLSAYESGELYPADLEMDYFLGLYRKIKRNNDMLLYYDSKKFTPKGTQGRSIKDLNHLRNRFVHFTPGRFEFPHGLSEMTLDCLEIGWFLAWDSNNVGWQGKDNADELVERAKKAFRTAAKAALEAGERPSNLLNSIVTDEFLETVSALEAAADELERARTDPYRWKWAILALHSALQGMMVIALQDSQDSKLKPFLELYDGIKSDFMLLLGDSKKFAPGRTLDTSIKDLNQLRDQFVHFTPGTLRLILKGLPEMTTDCLDIARFSVWNANNVGWQGKDDADELIKRVKKALAIASRAAQEMEEAYALPPQL